jgi:hypothetical protein
MIYGAPETVNRPPRNTDTINKIDVSCVAEEPQPIVNIGEPRIPLSEDAGFAVMENVQE